MHSGLSLPSLSIGNNFHSSFFQSINNIFLTARNFWKYSFLPFSTLPFPCPPFFLSCHFCSCYRYTANHDFSLLAFWMIHLLWCKHRCPCLSFRSCIFHIHGRNIGNNAFIYHFW